MPDPLIQHSVYKQGIKEIEFMALNDDCFGSALFYPNVSMYIWLLKSMPS